MVLLVLPVSPLYKHPSTGICWFKQGVPSRLAAVAKGQAVTIFVDVVPPQVKLGEYTKVSLRTKDPG